MLAIDITRALDLSMNRFSGFIFLPVIFLPFFVGAGLKINWQEYEGQEYAGERQ